MPTGTGAIIINTLFHFLNLIILGGLIYLMFRVIRWVLRLTRNKKVDKTKIKDL